MGPESYRSSMPNRSIAGSGHVIRLLPLRAIRRTHWPRSESRSVASYASASEILKLPDSGGTTRSWDLGLFALAETIWADCLFLTPAKTNTKKKNQTAREPSNGVASCRSRSSPERRRPLHHWNELRTSAARYRVQVSSHTGARGQGDVEDQVGGGASRYEDVPGLSGAGSGTPLRCRRGG